MPDHLSPMVGYILLPMNNSTVENINTHVSVCVREHKNGKEKIFFFKYSIQKVLKPVLHDFFNNF